MSNLYICRWKHKDKECPNCPHGIPHPLLDEQNEPCSKSGCVDQCTKQPCSWVTSDYKKNVYCQPATEEDIIVHLY